jgi:hypothetical protein
MSWAADLHLETLRLTQDGRALPRTTSRLMEGLTQRKRRKAMV